MAITISGSSPTFSGTYQGGVITAMTPVNTTGTFVDFTGIPSWTRRITIAISNLSSNGTSPFIIQIGSGSPQTTGYTSASGTAIHNTVPAVNGQTSGFVMYNDTAADASSRVMQIIYLGNFIYLSTWTLGGVTNRTVFGAGGGSVTLTALMDRVRLTTVNGTDSFDAGVMNVLYE